MASQNVYSAHLSDSNINYNHNKNIAVSCCTVYCPKYNRLRYESQPTIHSLSSPS